MTENNIADAGERMAFMHAADLVREYRSDLKRATITIRVQAAIIILLSIALLGVWLYGRYHG